MTKNQIICFVKIVVIAIAFFYIRFFKQLCHISLYNAKSAIILNNIEVNRKYENACID